MKMHVFHRLEFFSALLALPLTVAAGPALETQLWHADNGQDAALVSGLELGLDLPARLRLRARYEKGAFNPGGDVEQMDAWRGLITRAIGPWEFGAGYSAVGFATELQPDFVWSYPAEEQERNADAHGPVLHARVRQPLGQGPWNLRVAGTWLPWDFGDFDALGYDGAHLDLEADLIYARSRLEVGAGWRAVLFDDLPRRVENDTSYNRNRTQGPRLHLTMNF